MNRPHPVLGGILLLAALAFILLSHYPGSFNPDSLEQYEQALTGQYNDWHPPVMAFLWSLFLPLAQGALPMFIFQLGLLTASVILLYVHHARISHRRWVFLALPALPWIMALAGLLVKDVSMAFSLLFAFTAFHIWCDGGRSRALWGAAGVLCLCYAFMLRANAIFAVAPIIFYTLRYAFPQRKHWQSFILSCGILLLMLAGSHAFSVYVVKAELTNPTLFMKVDEISATSVMAGRNLFDPASPVHQWPVDKLHVRQSLDYRFMHAVGLSYAEVHANWKKVIREHPWAHIKARLYQYAVYYGLYPETYDNGLCLPSKYSPGAQKSLSEAVFTVWVRLWRDAQIFFRPIVWMCVAGALFIAMWRREDVAALEIRMLCGSAGCYQLGYLLVTAGPNYRFSYWPVLATCVALCIWLCQRPSAKVERT